VVSGLVGLTVLAGFLSLASRLRSVDMSMYIHIGKYESFVESCGVTIFHFTGTTRGGLYRMASWVHRFTCYAQYLRIKSIRDRR
jgi:hypothetical protein